MSKQVELLEDGTLTIVTSIKRRWLLLVALCLAGAAVCIAVFATGYVGKPQVWGLLLTSVGFVSLLFDRRVTIRVEVRAHEITVEERGPIRRRLRTFARNDIAAVRRVPVAAGYSNLTLVLTDGEKVELTQGLPRDEVVDLERQMRAALPEPAYR